MGDSKCALDDCRRPPSRDSRYCYFHKYDTEKRWLIESEKKRKEQEEKRKEQEERERFMREDKRIRQHRLRMEEVVKNRGDQLMSIAESIFPNIKSFRCWDSGNNVLLAIETDEQIWTYQQVSRRSDESIKNEMEQNYKNRGRPSYVRRYGRSRGGYDNYGDDINSVDGGPPSEASDDDG